MRILSLNINNFGGYKRPDINNADRISKFILNVMPDIVILQEFRKSVIGNDFIKNLKNEGWVVEYPKHPNGKDTCEKDVRFQSHVIALISEELKDYEIINPIINSKSKMWPRWIEIDISNIQIVGVHIPSWKDRPEDSESYWEDMKSYVNKIIDHKVMLIGDMNVYEKGTYSEKIFCEILDKGMKDACVEKGYSKDRPTSNYNTRIDYALMTASMIEDLIEVKIDDTLRDEGITDHSALLVEY